MTFQKGHPFYSGGEKSWFKKGQPSSLGMLGKHHSDKTKLMMSLSHIGKTPSVEHRKHLSESLKDNKNCLGRKMSTDNLTKLVKINTGKVLSQETRNKISQSNRGFIWTDTMRIKASNAKIGLMPKNMMGVGKYRNIVRGYFNINGKEMFFRSKWEANYALYLDFLIKQENVMIA